MQRTSLGCPNKPLEDLPPSIQLWEVYVDSISESPPNCRIEKVLMVGRCKHDGFALNGVDILEQADDNSL